MKNTQIAGKNSVQCHIDTYNNGLTEENVRGIILREKEILLKEAQIVACDIANKRLNAYTEILIPKLVENEVIEFLANPAVQMLYKNTEKTAICTDRKTDYEMLSELLIHRTKNDKNYVVKAAINKCVEIIDQISEEALLGITLVFAVSSIKPETGFINEGLKTLDEMFGNLISESNLPSGKNWVDNLELVQAIRIVPFSNISNFLDLFTDNLDGYFSDGIKYGTDKYTEYHNKLLDNKLPDFVKNNLLEGYYRIPVVAREKINRLKKCYTMTDDGMIAYNLSNNQIEILNNIFDNYEKNSNNLKKIKKNLKILLNNEYPNLNKIMQWWDNNVCSGLSFELTTVGKILAQLNAKTLDDRVPKIDE